MKQKVIIKEVISDLRELFQVGKVTGAREHNGKFMIDKQIAERGIVMQMLMEYFEDKVIDGGYLEVGSITFVHTMFEVLEGNPN